MSENTTHPATALLREIGDSEIVGAVEDALGRGIVTWSPGNPDEPDVWGLVPAGVDFGRTSGDDAYVVVWLDDQDFEVDEDRVLGKGGIHSCDDEIVEAGESPSYSGRFQVWDECAKCGRRVEGSERWDSVL